MVTVHSHLMVLYGDYLSIPLLFVENIIKTWSSKKNETEGGLVAITFNAFRVTVIASKNNRLQRSYDFIAKFRITKQHLKKRKISNDIFTRNHYEIFEISYWWFRGAVYHGTSSGDLAARVVTNRCGQSEKQYDLYVITSESDILVIW